MSDAVRMAYLVSRYPAVSHTFILREVLRLRELGLAIDPISINEPDRPDAGLTAEERAEAARTLYVKRAGIAGALRGLLHALHRPRRLVGALGAALRLGGSDPRALLYQLFYLAEALVVARFLDRRSLPHLHVHFLTPASMVGLLAARLSGCSLSTSAHGPDEFHDASLYRLREKVEAASFVCCIGSYCRSQLMKLTEPRVWDRLEICPLGVDPGQFAPRPFRDDPAPFEVICVGRLVPAKGQHVLLAAIDRLAREGRGVRLRLVGDGPDRASLEADCARRGLAGQVVFEGSVNQDRIRALYAQADAFALASFAEGIPVVLMEAMAMEIPCVSTFITGIPELIRDGVDGLLVPPSDEAALAEALARLMDDGALRRRLGAAGRLRVLDRYDLARNTERLAAVFRRRLGGAR